MRLMSSCLWLVIILSMQTPSCFASDSGDNSGIVTFVSKVQKTIKRNWFPPKPGFGLAVTIEVKVSQDGRLIRAHLLKSSGNQHADSAAMHAVSTAFPVKLDRRYLDHQDENLDLIIAFDWKKIAGGVSVTSSKASH